MVLSGRAGAGLPRHWNLSAGRHRAPGSRATNRRATSTARRRDRARTGTVATSATWCRRSRRCSRTPLTRVATPTASFSTCRPERNGEDRGKGPGPWLRIRSGAQVSLFTTKEPGEGLGLGSRPHVRRAIRWYAGLRRQRGHDSHSRSPCALARRTTDTDRQSFSADCR